MDILRMRLSSLSLPSIVPSFRFARTKYQFRRTRSLRHSYPLGALISYFTSECGSRAKFVRSWIRKAREASRGQLKSGRGGGKGRRWECGLRRIAEVLAGTFDKYRNTNTKWKENNLPGAAVKADESPAARVDIRTGTDANSGAN